MEGWVDGCVGGSLNAVNSRAPVELIRVQDILNFQFKQSNIFVVVFVNLYNCTCHLSNHSRILGPLMCTGY